jgi:hypothetical protein
MRRIIREGLVSPDAVRQRVAHISECNDKVHPVTTIARVAEQLDEDEAPERNRAAQ